MARNYPDFNAAQQAANQRMKPVKHEGEWVNPDKKAVERLKQNRADVRDYHQHIAPMKKTFVAAGVPFHALSDAMRVRGQQAGIRGRGKRERISHLAEIHNTDMPKFRDALAILFPSTKGKAF
jgi:hypothetical protein